MASIFIPSSLNDLPSVPDASPLYFQSCQPTFWIWVEYTTAGVPITVELFPSLIIFIPEVFIYPLEFQS